MFIIREICETKIKDKVLVGKFYISGFIDDPDLDKMIATLPRKVKLKAEQYKITKLQGV